MFCQSGEEGGELGLGGGGGPGQRMRRQRMGNESPNERGPAGATHGRVGCASRPGSAVHLERGISGCYCGFQAIDRRANSCYTIIAAVANLLQSSRAYSDANRSPRRRVCLGDRIGVLSPPTAKVWWAFAWCRTGLSRPAATEKGSRPLRIGSGRTQPY